MWTACHRKEYLQDRNRSVGKEVGTGDAETCFLLHRVLHRLVFDPPKFGIDVVSLNVGQSRNVRMCRWAVVALVEVVCR